MRIIYLLLLVMLITCGDDANDNNTEDAVEPTPTPTPTSTATPTSTPTPTTTTNPPPPDTGGNDDDDNDTPPAEITYFASTADDTKQAKITITTEAAEDSHFMLNINFTALRNILTSGLYPMLRVFLSRGAWQVVETDYGDIVGSNKCEKVESKCKNYVIFLKALQQDDHLSIKFKIPIALVFDLKQVFDVDFYLSKQEDAQLHFVSEDGTSVAEGTFPTDS